MAPGKGLFLVPGGAGGPEGGAGLPDGYLWYPPDNPPDESWTVTSRNGSYAPVVGNHQVIDLTLKTEHREGGQEHESYWNRETH